MTSSARSFDDVTRTGGGQAEEMHAVVVVTRGYPGRRYSGNPARVVNDVCVCK
jgi:hypothetical protein